MVRLGVRSLLARGGDVGRKFGELGVGKATITEAADCSVRLGEIPAAFAVGVGAVELVAGIWGRSIGGTS